MYIVLMDIKAGMYLTNEELNGINENGTADYSKAYSFSNKREAKAAALMIGKNYYVPVRISINISSTTIS